MTEQERLSIAAMRSLIIDEINNANSGHPGMALGSTPLMYTLFTRHINVNPKEPKWFNRDRFVLSAGHASAMLYATLHLSGFDVTLDDIKSFRKVGSRTPGHPEFGVTVGVDATSGPLGQGIAQAVGMALAERFIQASYPQGSKIMNHFTYCLCGDGCLHEGISQEAISFAGHQKLNKLILLYDANKVTLDGPLSLSFSEDVKARFVASNWNVLEVKDGNDIEEIDTAIQKAKQSKDKPTMIMVNTVIGFGSLKEGTSKTHGAPLGEEDGKHAKVDVYGFDHENFFVPTEVYEDFKDKVLLRGEKAFKEYKNEFELYKNEFPKEADQFEKLMNNNYSSFDLNSYPTFEEGISISTRGASGKALNYYHQILPNMIGGSADVAGSAMTKIEGAVNQTFETPEGKNVYWGIREFAMAAMQNGMVLHGGTRPYIACFFSFADYMKPAIRMASLTEIPSLFIFTHDSIMVGEDGPTHQPIEQLAMLRSIPNLNVIRPCDERETFGAYSVALQSKQTPTALVLSRHNLPTIIGSKADEVKKGGYVISKEKNKAQATLVATGSEVSLAIETQKVLLEQGIDVRVVSLPSWELFDAQGEEYIEETLGNYETRISVENLSSFGWKKYAKYSFSIDRFGLSGTGKEVAKALGFTLDNLVELVKKVVK